MKQLKFLRTISLIIAVGLPAFVLSCNNEEKKEKEDGMEDHKEMSNEDMIKRGNYIMITAGCHDCHSPKKFGPHGEMMLDSSKLLSGHPENMPLPPVNVKSLEPGQWMSLSGDLTAFVGPWGMSYTANLTPDSATGIGAWNESQFINALRKGQHLGNGRPIMPPMPWEFIAKMTDDDLKAVFAYLKSLPAVKNAVHPPYSPDEVKQMAATK